MTFTYSEIMDILEQAVEIMAMRGLNRACIVLILRRAAEILETEEKNDRAN